MLKLKRVLTLTGFFYAVTVLLKNGACVSVYACKCVFMCEVGVCMLPWIQVAWRQVVVQLYLSQPLLFGMVSTSALRQ